MEKRKEVEEIEEIQKITSSFKKLNEKLTCKEADRRIRDFQCKMYLYLEMEGRVALGKWEHGAVQIHGDSSGVEQTIPWEYVQRAIIFNQEQELRLIRSGEGFLGRLRRDGAEEGSCCYILDEAQKIWGEAEKEDEDWILLTSKRGSRIWVPWDSGETKTVETVGIRIRKYFAFPDNAAEGGMISQVDERMVEFCLWPLGREEYENGAFYKPV